jgi:hypothetical protein
VFLAAQAAYLAESTASRNTAGIVPPVRAAIQPPVTPQAEPKGPPHKAPSEALTATCEAPGTTKPAASIVGTAREPVATPKPSVTVTPAAAAKSTTEPTTATAAARTATTAATATNGGFRVCMSVTADNRAGMRHGVAAGTPLGTISGATPASGQPQTRTDAMVQATPHRSATTFPTWPPRTATTGTTSEAAPPAANLSLNTSTAGEYPGFTAYARAIGLGTPAQSTIETV